MPNSAFVLLFAGVLLVYCEFIWVGKIIFGTVGALLILGAFAIFSRVPVALPGVGLIGAGIVLFVIESAIRTYYLAGILATAALAIGFWKLNVAPELAWLLSIIFGTLTTALLSKAKQARRNKQTDL